SRSWTSQAANEVPPAPHPPTGKPCRFLRSRSAPRTFETLRNSPASAGRNAGSAVHRLQKLFGNACKSSDHQSWGADFSSTHGFVSYMVQNHLDKSQSRLGERLVFTINQTQP